MEELKQEATELGLDFAGNISKASLIKLIEDAKNPIANDSTTLEVKPRDLMERIRVKITPRDSGERDGYIGWSDYSASYQFDTELSMPIGAVEFLQSKGGNITDSKGNKKWVSRYIIEKL